MASCARIHTYTHILRWTNDIQTSVSLSVIRPLVPDLKCNFHSTERIAIATKCNYNATRYVFRFIYNFAIHSQRHTIVVAWLTTTEMSEYFFFFFWIHKTEHFLCLVVELLNLIQRPKTAFLVHTFVTNVTIIFLPSLRSFNNYVRLLNSLVGSRHEIRF